MARFGRKIVAGGLASSRFGNISMRVDDRIAITKTGSMLDELSPDQIVEVDLEPCSLDSIASSETCVHRAVYNRTQAKAIIHTHSPYAVAMSLVLKDSIEPIDGEGMAFLGSVPIVSGGFGTDLLAENVSSALQDHRACIARGHGVFAVGESLADAYTVACMTEHSSQIRYLVGLCRT